MHLVHSVGGTGAEEWRRTGRVAANRAAAGTEVRMKASFERSNQFLQRTLDWEPRVLMVVAALLLLPTYLLPLWVVSGTPEAGAATVRVYSHKVEVFRDTALAKDPDAARERFPSEPRRIQWLPFVVGVLALLLLRAPVHGRLRDLVDVSVLYAYFCGFILWSFADTISEYRRAVLAGRDQFATTAVAAHPAGGGYFLAAVAVVLVMALALAWRQARAENTAEIRAAG